MVERMPCRELFLVGHIDDRFAIVGPAPDGQRCAGCLIEADGMTMDHYRPYADALARLEELRMFESRSLMEMPDG